MNICPFFGCTTLKWIIFDLLLFFYSVYDKWTGEKNSPILQAEEKEQDQGVNNEVSEVKHIFRILDGILYQNCLVFPEEQTSRLVKEAKAPGHGRSQKSLGWLWWRRGLPESRGGCGKGWETGVDIQYMESSTVQDDLQALVQKSVCRKWWRWRGEKEEQSRVKSHLCILGDRFQTNLFLHNKTFLAFLWCLE